MTESVAPQIMIVDDARDIREPLAQYLRKQGFRTRLAANAAEARKIQSEAVIHLVVLDIMMPGEDGLSLYRSQFADNRVPVIFLTARTEEIDRIIGLELGADDYVCKPFNPRELLARISAVLRRTPAERPAPGVARRRFGGLVHDAGRQRVLREDGSEIKLTSGENRLLGTFLDHPGDILSRAQLLDQISGREAKAYDRAVDNTVSRLRRKLGDDTGSPWLIVTEWGGGYRLVATVEKIS